MAYVLLTALPTYPSTFPAQLCLVLDLDLDLDLDLALRVTPAQPRVMYVSLGCIE